VTAQTSDRQVFLRAPNSFPVSIECFARDDVDLLPCTAAAAAVLRGDFKSVAEEKSPDWAMTKSGLKS
jgi:hypothetical protein